MESISLMAAERPRLTQRYPGFSSFKTLTSIHYEHRWMRDALIVMSLDQHTLSLAPSSTPTFELPLPAEFSFRRRTVAGPGIVLVTQLETDIEDIVADDRVTVLSRAALSRDPALGVARAIWTQKRTTVDPADRYRALDIVTARRSAAMHEVVGALRSESVDRIHAVCSLLANSYLEMNLDGGLGPWSELKMGPASFAGASDKD